MGNAWDRMGLGPSTLAEIGSKAATKTKIRKCERCGWQIRTHGGKKYCGPCSSVVRAERRRAYQAKAKRRRRSWDWITELMHEALICVRDGRPVGSHRAGAIASLSRRNWISRRKGERWHLTDLGMSVVGINDVFFAVTGEMIGG
ncbi:MAG: hypothetical protein V3W44_09710 [Dehalococcoidales bacterium]